MTLDLNTFVSNFLYTHASAMNDVEFYKYIESIQTHTSDCMRNGTVYPFQRVHRSEKIQTIKKNGVSEAFILPEAYYYVETFEFVIAHKMVLEEIKPTLAGRPHLHFGILSESTTNPDLLEHELEEFIRRKLGGRVNDIKFDRRVTQKKKDKDMVHSKVYDSTASPSGVFNYVLKNTSQIIVQKLLKKYSSFYYDPNEEDHFVRSYVNINKKHAEVISSLLITISDWKHKKSTGTSTSKEYQRNRVAAQIVFLYSKRTKSENVSNFIPVDEIYLADPEIDKGKFLLERAIQDNMSKNFLAISKGHLFRQNRGSKSSWIFVSSALEYLESMINNTKFKITKPTIERILTMMNNDNKNVTQLAESSLITFRQVSINYRMVELKDGYLSLETSKLYRTQEKYHTYLYYPALSINDIYVELAKYLIDGETLKYFKSGRGEFNLFHRHTFFLFAKALIKRIAGESRNNVLALMGGPGTGKSTIADILEAVFPTHEVGKPTEINDFEFFYYYKDKEFISMTEASSAMGNYGTNRENALVLFEARQISANEKHGSKGLTSSDFGIILTSNILGKTRPFVSDCALSDRINYKYTGKTENSIIKEVLLADTIKEELPIILILISMCRISYENQLDFLPQLQIEDSLDGEDLMLLDRCFLIGKNEIDPEISSSKIINDYAKKTRERGYSKVDISPLLLPSVDNVIVNHRNKILAEYDRPSQTR
jgi:hypothetical protein